MGLELQPLSQDCHCDIAIIGGGYTGLSAAIELAENGLDVCLLEAGAIGWGASGRNGGFACIGSHKLSYKTMIKRYGLEATKEFHNAMRDSVDRVPYVGPLDDNKTVWTALAYHGNGVAMGTWTGRTLARMMLNKTANTKVPAVITRRLAKFPLPMFRPYYLKGAYLWYGWQDGR